MKLGPIHIIIVLIGIFSLAVPGFGVITQFSSTDLTLFLVGTFITTLYCSWGIEWILGKESVELTGSEESK